MTPILVIKLDLDGQETWRYQGYVLERDKHKIILEAYFDRQDIWFNGILLANGDRFIETYYDDRWYNVFEIYNHQIGQLKGWYCNISRPAKISDHVVSYQDLALDLLVFPDGRQILLDEKEFNALSLIPEESAQAIKALKDLKLRFRKKFEQYSSDKTGEVRGDA